MRPMPIRALLTTALLVGVATAAEESATIHWEKNLAGAKARSAETGRPVIAYFTFDT